MAIADPVEAKIAEGLDDAGIKYDRPENGLDFYLPAFDTYIECKAMYSARILDQMQRAPNIIVIQGIGAAKTFASMLSIIGRRTQP